VFVASTSSNNLIGSNPTAQSGFVANVISGNSGNGITLSGSSGNILVDNRVGTDPTGATAIGNSGNGIYVTAGANNNTIGGNAFTDSNTGAVNNPTGTKGSVPEVYVVPPLGNQVSGNGMNGILIDTGSTLNTLSGNFVGTTANGDAALGNTLDGVAINGANGNQLIGCLVNQNPFVYYNVVSGNGGNGLHITDSNNITVQANFFGIGADNTTIVGNALNGILVDGSSVNTQVGGVIPLGNVSAGNTLNGISVAGTVSGFTTFNTFGGLLAFKGAAPNGGDGLLITATGGNQTVQTNVFSGNTGNGIEIGGNASGVTIDPNIVGLTTNGGTILANGGDGLLINGTAHNITVGGYQQSVIPQNLFSGNVGYGVEITGQAHDNTVFNSYIGTQVFGVQAAGNQAGGILIGGSATNNIIGGAGGTQQQPKADVISGNGGIGVTLSSTSTNTSIIGDVIGYDVGGTIPVPNAGAAIVTNGSTGNVIAGNTVACFAKGTMIATAQGPIAVEALTPGMRVTLADGGTRPLVWLGRRRIDCTRHPKPTDVWPVRVKAHALGKALPAADLLLSPDHAVFMNDVLIPVRYLVNGRTVVQEQCAEVTYFHVELNHHSVILAQGMPCESYLDTGNKADFENGGTLVRMHPSFARDVWTAGACADLVVGGAALKAARRFTLDRAAEAGHTTTTRPNIKLLVDGRLLAPKVSGTTHRFTIPAGARTVSLVSRSAVPAELQDQSPETRRLGVAIGAMEFDGQPISLDDGRLGQGWHASEAGATWRWTDGQARIEGAAGTVLEIDVVISEVYWNDAARHEAQRRPA